MTMFARPRRLANTRRRERGVTLLETLLVIGALALLTATSLTVISNVAKQTVREATARRLLVVQRAAEEYARTNFTGLTDVSVPGNIAGVGQVRALDIEDLADENFLTAPATDVLPMSLRMRVFLRNDTPAGSLPAIEVVTTTENLTGSTPQNGLVFDELLDTALFGRGKIGILSNAAPYTTTQFRSVSNEWSVPVVNLTGYSLATPTTTPARGYLAAYGRMTSEDIFDTNVLYRIPVAGNSDFNRMSTDLNMGGYAIRNASTMTADRLSAANVSLTGDGGYALSTEGTLEITGNLQMAGGVTVFGDGNAGTNDLQVASVNTPNGTVAASTVNANQLNANAGGLITRNMTVTNNVNGRDMYVNTDFAVTNSNITTNSLQMNGAGVATLNTSSLNARNVISGTTNMTGTYTANTNGTHVVTDNARATNTLSIPSLQANEAQFQNLCYTSGAAHGIEQCP